MTEQAQKKRQPKPGLRRVTVTIEEAEYGNLVEVAAKQMREPNNLLSFMLKDRIGSMLSDFED